MSEADRLDWVRLAAIAADDKKASDTLIIDVGEVLAVTDYFVITSAANARQVAAITEAIEERLRLAFGIKPHRVEGREAREWVLLDYGDFVVHVFQTEQRAFYRLERLWGDRPRLEWS